jgi:glycine hydroxymethyltransferase
VRLENRRQEEHIELIASENYASPGGAWPRRAAQLTNKYAEGYPGKRYYGGCEYVDVAEQLAIDRAKQLFGAEHRQRPAATPARRPTRRCSSALLEARRHDPGHEPGARRPPHPWLAASTCPGKWFKVGAATACAARTDASTTTRWSGSPSEHKPQADHRRRLGLSARHRLRTLRRGRATRSAPIFMVDMAHYRRPRRRRRAIRTRCRMPHVVDHHDAQDAARPARRHHPAPTTEHRARRSTAPIFPGLQGGPLMHVIAAKAVAFGEALQPRVQGLPAAGASPTRGRSAATLTERGLRIVIAAAPTAT